MTNDAPTAHGAPSSPPPDATATVPPAAAFTDSPPAFPPAAPAFVDVPDAPPGYQILAELGRGGMGVVYKARQVRAGRTVALKMILSGSHAGADELDRFKTEAEAIARLQHPGIVQVFEVGEYQGRPFFSLEFCPGGALDRKLGGTPLHPNEAAALVEALARAVQAAHDRGVIHRDLKPANVLLAEDGTPKVTDFGLAKKLDEAGRTATGAVMGTPSYMAPEQAGGKTVGPLADVYALGAILYECLTGRPPFRAATPLDTVLQVVSEEPVPPSQLNARVPRDLETICLKCLQKEPARRYLGAAEFAEDLSRFQRGEPIQARPVGRLERGWRWCRRNPAVAGLLAAVALVLCAGIVTSTLFAIDAGDQAEAARLRAQEAQAAHDLADTRAEQARDERRRSDRRRYTSDILLAHRAYQDSHLARARQLLAGLTPDQLGGEELRHFEWHYLTAQCDGPTLEGMMVSPDGRHVFRIGKPGVVIDRATGKQVATLPGSPPWFPVLGTGWSGDGGRFMTVVQEGNEAERKLKIWDVPTGKVVREFPTRGPVGTALDSAGRRVAVWQRPFGDNTVLEVFDPDTGESLFRDSQGGDREVMRLAFSPDGNLLACACKPPGKSVEIAIWDLAKKEVATLPPGPGQVTALTMGRGVLLSGWQDGQVLLMRRADGPGQGPGKLLGRLSGGVSSVAVSADERLIAAAGDPRGSAGEIRVWDSGTGRAVAAFPGNPGGTFQMAFLPGDPPRLVSAGGGHEVRTWRLDSLALALARLASERMPNVAALAWHPSGRQVAVSLGDSVPLWGRGALDDGGPDPEGEAGKVVILDVAGRVHRRLGDRSHHALAYSPDGKRLAAVRPGAAAVWDLETGKQAFEVKAPKDNHPAGPISSVAFSADGKRLLVAGNFGRAVMLFTGVTILDVASGATQAVFLTRAPVARACFLPDGRHVAALVPPDRDLASGALIVWDVVAKRVVWETEIREDTTALACSPDGRWIVTGGEKSSLQFWAAATGERGPTWQGHTGMVTAVAFSADGLRLFSAGWDQTVRVWDVTSGEALLQLSRDEGDGRRYHFALDALAVSPDGRALAALNGRCLIWSAARN